MKTTPLTLAAAELDVPTGMVLQVRVPLRLNNTSAMGATFAQVDFETGRASRNTAAHTHIRARAKFRYGTRVVTCWARFAPGDLLAVTTARRGIRRRLLRYRILEVHGRRVRDVRRGDGFATEAWVARHGRAAWDRNPWVWALTVVPERAR